ncbi:DNA repair protein RadC [Caballeronia sp. LZ062]|uniref:RadC family protein n=1 Tax=unclassified Caballeronia TaxID=2646786 RepID=UPI00285D55C7|nr:MULTISPECIES: DNA repair protein RadC [unclassified Caballeronia]MDR5853806.1 DNA repair protein RadC [Caballeronia sp. LZ050]MDR5871662.1 DNA repair protein RadC [Caballeronia sp. LZ062]
MTGIVAPGFAPEVAPDLAPEIAPVPASLTAADAAPVATSDVAPVAASVPTAPSEAAETVRLAALAISKWDKADRPRERLLNSGAEMLSDAELLALFLRTGVPGLTAVDVARALLRRFGSLRAMLSAPAAELQAERGIGEARAATLIAVSELCRRMLAEKARNRILLNSPGAVEDFLRLKIGTRPNEVFICIYLDARHQLLDIREEARGSLTRVAVYPREIVKRALSLNAAGLIVAHNHPSGANQPSAGDRKLTRTLLDALALIDVKLLDHMVVASNDIFSFAREGWL